VYHEIAYGISYKPVPEILIFFGSAYGSLNENEKVANLDEKLIFFFYYDLKFVVISLFVSNLEHFLPLTHCVRGVFPFFAPSCH
jgi:phosphate starvation-inducible membrane PsiE